MSKPLAWRSLLLDSTGVIARFYGRVGGHGEGALASLNMGALVDDDPALLAANEALVLDDLGATSLYLPQQVHGAAVQVVNRVEPGVVRGEPGDAVWTDRRGVAVGVLTADCVPLLLTTENGDFVGAIHAGWRGLYGGIIGRAIERITRLFCCRPFDLLAAIGPAIGPEQYEVSRELAQQFLTDRPELRGVLWPEKRKKPRLDLRTMALNDLLHNEVSRENIELVGPTTDDERCFSHRRDKGRTGRQLSAILMA